MKFYMYMQDKVVGPYGPDEIMKQFGGVSPETLVSYADKYTGGSVKWRIIGNVPELAGCIKYEISEPLAHDPAAPMAPMVPAQKLSLHVLSTDDDANIRELLWHMLEDAGHTVEFAKDGEEVFKRLSEKKYDLVILDVNMPKMNGYKVSELIHKKISNPPRIIIFTGRDLQKERLQFMCSGADAILSKGIDNDKLIRTVEDLFLKKQELTTKAREEAFTPEPTPQVLAETRVNKPESPDKRPETAASAEAPPGVRPLPPVPAGITACSALQSNDTIVIPRPSESAVPQMVRNAVEALPAANRPAQNMDTGGGPDAATDLSPAQNKAQGVGLPDMNLLMGHIDLECARLEMQFEKHALKLLETNRDASRKLQVEWKKLRYSMALTAILLLVSVFLAVFLR